MKDDLLPWIPCFIMKGIYSIIHIVLAKSLITINLSLQKTILSASQLEMVALNRMSCIWSAAPAFTHDCGCSQDPNHHKHAWIPTENSVPGEPHMHIQRFEEHLDPRCLEP